ncbi:TetR/AcrR family transcriptional regulator [Herbiconiux sp. YIM B11900]|uniref:TetR/AcrR family transcriptional regulator n=1 Tax=Herbiconiux sp. YIM B11900 TaxID=3404131 RepID=UPI003F86047B
MPSTAAAASAALVVEPVVRASPARERLLGVASDLFYREGIHRVGMDRLLAEAGVTRATMYRHFSGKEALVAAYLEREDALARAGFAARHPESADELIEWVADDVAGTHPRGCPFINAAAEYPDPDSAVRRIVRGHRAWFRETVTRVLEKTPVPDATAAADALVLLRDAALVGCSLDGPAVARPAFVATARRLLAP